MPPDDSVQVGRMEIPVEFTLDRKTMEGKFKKDAEAAGRRIGQRQAEVQATEFVKRLEVEYQRRLGEAREELMRGLIDRKEFAKRGRQAAQAMNAAILDELERRGNAGQLGRAYTEDFNVLTESFKDIGGASRSSTRGVGEMRESFASLLAQAVDVHPVLGRIVNVLGGLAVSSVIMGAALGGLAALIFTWKKVTEETRKARQETKEALDELDRLRERRALGPRGETGALVDAAQRRVDELKAELEEARAFADLTVEEQMARAEQLRIPRTIAEIEKDLAEAQEKIQAGEAEIQETMAEAARNRRDQEVANLAALISANQATEAEMERAREVIRQEQELIEHLLEADPTATVLEERARAISRIRQLEGAMTKGRDDKSVERAAERLAGLEATMRTRLAALTATATDELLLQIETMEREARVAAAEAGTTVSEEFLQGLARLRDDARLQGVLETYQEAFRTISRAPADADAQADLDLFIQRLHEEVDALDEGSTAAAAFNELLRKALDLREKNAEAIRKEAEELEKKNKKSEEEAAKEAERQAREELRDLRDRARLLEENARAAIQLAQAFGAVSDETAQVLQNIAQVGAAVVRIAGGDLTAIPSAIGGLAGLISGLSGDEEEARQKEIQAMHDLERALYALEGSVRRDLSERERQDLLGIGRSFLTGQGANTESPSFVRFVERIKQLTGIDILGEDGVNVDDTKLRAALEALEELSAGPFADDLIGQLDALSLRLRLLGDDAGSADEIMEDFLKILSGFKGAGGFAEILRQTLETQGTEGARTFVNDLIAQLLDPATRDEVIGAFPFFGQLTTEEILRVLEDSQGFLERIAGAAGVSGTSRDVVVARSITSIQASRIEGALYAENAFSAERNELLRRLVAASVPQAPSFGALSLQSVGTPQGGGVTVRIERVVDGGIHVSASGGDGVVEAVRSQLETELTRAGTFLADEIDRQLGQKRRKRLKAQGRAS